jgi:hypothetical protein
MEMGCHLYVPDLCRRNFYIYVGVKNKELECVYCAVCTESLNINQVHFQVYRVKRV